MKTFWFSIPNEIQTSNKVNDVILLQRQLKEIRNKDLMKLKDRLARRKLSSSSNKRNLELLYYFSFDKSKKSYIFISNS